VSVPFLLGAVAYDPKVVTIWDGFRKWLRERDFEFDYVLYSNYERQVEELLGGRIDVAWNSPLAWVRAQRLAVAKGVRVEAILMRDTDRDLRSVVAVRADSDIAEVAQLRGRTVAVGAVDSPQATLLPLDILRENGIAPGHDFSVQRFDIGVGLHGDHIGGEREAATALRDGWVDAACMIDANLLMFAREGLFPADSVRMVATTGLYDHCNMTSGPAADEAGVNRFTELLLNMSYSDAEARPLLDLEGLHEWLPGRLTGYPALIRAVDAASFYDSSGAVIATDYRP
jgi:phosphonate transport system substrate-binding protein